MRDRITTALECVGALLIAAGCGIWLGVAAALIVGGVFLMVFAYLADSQ